MIDLVDRIIRLDSALDDAAIPHAFGGALALAWCTRQARGTIDIDVNLFVDVEHSSTVLDALPAGVTVTDDNIAEIDRDGQTRLWWDRVPVDVFFNTTPFHAAAALRARRETFAGRPVPFLGCSDLAVFKAFVDRPRDWVDLAEMHQADSLDLAHVIGVLTTYLGADDPRIARLQSLTR
jgi:hypothetical protein